jgi:hypothetical protein
MHEHPAARRAPAGQKQNPQPVAQNKRSKTKLATANAGVAAAGRFAGRIGV